MIYTAANQGEESRRIGLGEIAEAINSPKAFTAKILQQLSKAQLLDSVRGRFGGFVLNKRKSISLQDIILAMDGDKLIKGCFLGFGECGDDHPCPIHFKMKEAREVLKLTLNSTTMKDLETVVNGEQAFLREF